MNVKRTLEDTLKDTQEDTPVDTQEDRNNVRPKKTVGEELTYD